MYRREVFEEIGYFDERHFCYLEDVDIGYLAKLFGYRNLYVPAAVVDHWGSAASGAVHNPFKEEMTAGNNAYLLYKNMPVGQFVLNAPLLWLGREIKRHYFAGKGLGKAYNTGIERGRLLRERAKAMQRAKEAGTPLPKAALAKEAALPEDALGRTPAEKINPLYLGEKQPFALRRLPRYAGIQMELWANTLRRLFS